MSELGRNRSSPTDGVLPAEADRVPTEQLAETHVQHPGAPHEFRKSALLVGARGAGKTFLLRHRRHFVHERALYINLRVELKSLATSYGIGSQALELPADLELIVARQAASLVALAILRELLDRDDPNGNLDSALLTPLLPPAIGVPSGSLSLTTIMDCRRAVRASRDEVWLADQFVPGDLSDFLGELARVVDEPLTLFLDRADDVPAAAVSQLVTLLDQSAPYLLVIAGRPAVAHAIPSLHDPGSVPSDHYDVIHLGTEPYSSAWQEFSMEAVERYLAANDIEPGSTDSVKWCHLMGRDSLRRSARLVQIARSTEGSIAQRTTQVGMLRDSLLAKVRGEMRNLHKDFSVYLRSITDQAASALGSGPQVALEIEIDDARSAFDLLGERDQFSHALLRSIRAEALNLPQGVEWHPYELPTRFEITPLIAWNGRNVQWIQ